MRGVLMTVPYRLYSQCRLLQRTRFLVFDGIPRYTSACLVCMFLPLLYPSRYPRSICVHSIAVCISCFFCYSLLYFSYGNVFLCFICLACLLSPVCHFRDTGSLVDFGGNSHHFTSTISHLRESHLGKITLHRSSHFVAGSPE